MTASGSRRQHRCGERDERPVLPDVTRDESDEGWGDDRDADRRDEAWYRRERPPHHDAR
jgi:hypothetical protein